MKDDAAHTYLGGSWHMPTPTQIKELIDNTTTTWTTLDEVSGMAFTSKSDTSKTIFIPAAGYALNGSVNALGTFGDVWSVMLSDSSIIYGQDLNITMGTVFQENNNHRYDGLSVRGVIG